MKKQLIEEFSAEIQEAIRNRRAVADSDVSIEEYLLVAHQSLTSLENTTEISRGIGSK